MLFEVESYKNVYPGYFPVTSQIERDEKTWKTCISKDKFSNFEIHDYIN
jgi:hypothetical protein